MTDRVETRIAMGFKTAAEAVGLSKRFLEMAARETDSERKLRTVRVNRRRLIRTEDLKDWFNRVSKEENKTA